IAALIDGLAQADISDQVEQRCWISEQEFSDILGLWLVHAGARMLLVSQSAWERRYEDWPSGRCSLWLRLFIPLMIGFLLGCASFITLISPSCRSVCASAGLL